MEQSRVPAAFRLDWSDFDRLTDFAALLGIGQPLALLLKQSSVITELALYDIVPVVKGVAADISHVDTPSVVTGYTRDDDGLKLALTGAHIVVIPAGIPRKVSPTIRSLALPLADLPSLRRPPRRPDHTHPSLRYS